MGKKAETLKVLYDGLYDSFHRVKEERDWALDTLIEEQKKVKRLEEVARETSDHLVILAHEADGMEEELRSQDIYTVPPPPTAGDVWEDEEGARLVVDHVQTGTRPLVWARPFKGSGEGASYGLDWFMSTFKYVF